MKENKTLISSKVFEQLDFKWGEIRVEQPFSHSIKVLIYQKQKYPIIYAKFSAIGGLEENGIREWEIWTKFMRASEHILFSGRLHTKSDLIKILKLVI